MSGAAMFWPLMILYGLALGAVCPASAYLTYGVMVGFLALRERIETHRHRSTHARS
jgi:hypothetical protein